MAKATTHVCLGELLRKLEPDFDYNSFDRFRCIRNSINYYGKAIGLMEGKDVINKMLQMRKNNPIKLVLKIKQDKND